MGHRFTEIVAVEWREVLDRRWNSERPLVFAHVVLTKTLGTYKAREIRASNNLRLDLWERLSTQAWWGVRWWKGGPENAVL